MNASYKFKDTTLPENQVFYNYLKVEDIVDLDYTHAERVCIKILKAKLWLTLANFGFLVADAFESFPNVCLEIYRLDLVYFLSEPLLKWQAALKNTKLKLHLFINIFILLMVEKGIRGSIDHAKANNKYMKAYNKNKESSGWKQLIFYAQYIRLPLGGFKWIQNTSQFRKIFIEICNQDSNGAYFLERNV